MRETYAVRQAVRAGTEPHHGEIRNGEGESRVRLGMVAAPGGVAFVEVEPGTERTQAMQEPNDPDLRPQHDEIPRKSSKNLQPGR